MADTKPRHHVRDHIGNPLGVISDTLVPATVARKACRLPMRSTGRINQRHLYDSMPQFTTINTMIPTSCAHHKNGLGRAKSASRAAVPLGADSWA